MKNHRCEGSLANEISIRKDYGNKLVKDINGDVKQWRMFNYQYDFDSDDYYEECIAKIDYCPFCGDKLEQESD